MGEFDVGDPDDYWTHWMCFVVKSGGLSESQNNWKPSLTRLFSNHRRCCLISEPIDQSELPKLQEAMICPCLPAGSEILFDAEDLSFSWSGVAP